MSVEIIHNQNTISRGAFWKNTKTDEFIKSWDIIWSLIDINSNIATVIYCRKYAPTMRSLAGSSHTAWKASRWSFISLMCCSFVCCTFINKNKLIWIPFSQTSKPVATELLIAFTSDRFNLLVQDFQLLQGSWDCERANRDSIFFKYKCSGFVKICSAICNEKVLKSLGQSVSVSIS